MPELPEVETIANGLRQGRSTPLAAAHPALPGMRILGTQLLWERSLATPTPAEFATRLPGQSFEEIGRRGKFLVAKLSQDTLIVHLRMSGDLLVEPLDAPLPLHHRLVLTLQGGWRFALNDTRKFARVWLVQDPQTVLNELGPEPFDPTLTPAVFYTILQGSRRQLKPLLLDQHVIAGLGNIYTDEALYLAGLHPLTVSNSVSEERAAKLLETIRSVLQSGIHHHGASIDWVYRGGDFQNYFLVYQRTGAPCKGCGTPIQRIVVGQRGTHFCPRCQPEVPK
ncbi:MAG: bifunctional DNA-formamidopyrimidine glycosylase/DNA-(apurinic or apyrimidinic site) lyase [Anaerolineales bacterium]|jgi:formamidopyrimidine-DNA glycosylase|nr:bifunctional DNA-formamidopyrimidine glycosylase/DNA-(apurinic or apyrimidinic site) lyase [Anaerolineales bacterium]